MSTSADTRLTAMVTAVARGLVDHPDDVRVETRPGATIGLDIHVADEDLGQVIGRGGRIARALRTVVRQAAETQGAKARLEIVD